MDNSLFAQIETLGGKVYFFGECVWATQLKIKLRHYKIAILYCTPEVVIPLLDKYEIQPVKQTLRFKDDGVLYELYFPKDLCIYLAALELYQILKQFFLLSFQ